MKSCPVCSQKLHKSAHICQDCGHDIDRSLFSGNLHPGEIERNHQQIAFEKTRYEILKRQSEEVSENLRTIIELQTILGQLQSQTVNIPDSLRIINDETNEIIIDRLEGGFQDISNKFNKHLIEQKNDYKTTLDSLTKKLNNHSSNIEEQLNAIKKNLFTSNQAFKATEKVLIHIDQIKQTVDSQGDISGNLKVLKTELNNLRSDISKISNQQKTFSKELSSTHEAVHEIFSKNIPTIINELENKFSKRLSIFIRRIDTVQHSVRTHSNLLFIILLLFFVFSIAYGAFFSTVQEKNYNKLIKEINRIREINKNSSTVTESSTKKDKETLRKILSESISSDSLNAEILNPYSNDIFRDTPPELASCVSSNTDIPKHPSSNNKETKHVLPTLKNNGQEIIINDSDSQDEKIKKRPVINGEQITIGKEKLVMIEVPPGSFVMGMFNEPLFDQDNTPSYIEMNQYWMSRDEITEAIYEEIMDESKPKIPSQNYPVIGVSWYDAVIFCNRLSVRLGYEPCYDEMSFKCDFNKNGYRLPTEAEWEYACRAGTVSLFHTGETSLSIFSLNKIGDPNYSKSPALGKVGWYHHNSDSVLHMVGMKKSNNWDFYDMHGNVSEWCNSISELYPFHLVNPFESSNHINNNQHSGVVKGGNYLSSAYECGSGFKDEVMIHKGSEIIGFRIVRSEYQRFSFRIYGKLDGENDILVSGIHVLLKSYDAPVEIERKTVTNGEGIFIFDDLPIGMYSIRYRNEKKLKFMYMNNSLEYSLKEENIVRILSADVILAKDFVKRRGFME